MVVIMKKIFLTFFLVLVHTNLPMGIPVTGDISRILNKLYPHRKQKQPSAKTPVSKPATSKSYSPTTIPKTKSPAPIKPKKTAPKVKIKSKHKSKPVKIKYKPKAAPIVVPKVSVIKTEEASEKIILPTPLVSVASKILIFSQKLDADSLEELPSVTYSSYKIIFKELESNAKVTQYKVNNFAIYRKDLFEGLQELEESLEEYSGYPEVKKALEYISNYQAANWMPVTSKVDLTTLQEILMLQIPDKSKIDQEVILEASRAFDNIAKDFEHSHKDWFIAMDKQREQATKDLILNKSLTVVNLSPSELEEYNNAQNAEKTVLAIKTKLAKFHQITGNPKVIATLKELESTSENLEFYKNEISEYKETLLKDISYLPRKEWWSEEEDDLIEEQIKKIEAEISKLPGKSEVKASETEEPAKEESDKANSNDNASYNLLPLVSLALYKLSTKAAKTETYKDAQKESYKVQNLQLTPDQEAKAQKLMEETTSLTLASAIENLNFLAENKILNNLTTNLGKIESNLDSNSASNTLKIIEEMRNNILTYQAANQMLAPSSEISNIDPVDAMLIMGYASKVDPEDKPIELPSESILKKDYRKLALQLHPDKGGNTEQFQLLNESYKSLLDAITGADKLKKLNPKQALELEAARSAQLTAKALSQGTEQLELSISNLEESAKQSVELLTGKAKTLSSKFLEASQKTTLAKAKVEKLKEDISSTVAEFPNKTPELEKVLEPVADAVEAEKPTKPKTKTGKAPKLSSGQAASLFINQSKILEMQKAALALQAKTLNPSADKTLLNITSSVKELEQEEAKKEKTLRKSGEILDKVSRYLEEIESSVTNKPEEKPVFDVIQFFQQGVDAYKSALPQDMPKSELSQQAAHFFGKATKELGQSMLSIHKEQRAADKKLKEMEALVLEFENSSKELSKQEEAQKVAEKNIMKSSQKLAKTTTGLKPHQAKAVDSFLRTIQRGFKWMPK